MKSNPPSTQRFLAALAIVCSLAVPVTVAGASDPAVPSSVRDLSTVKIDNFGRISDTYYRGSQPVGSDYASLAAVGVRTVINLTSDDSTAEEESLVEHAGMSYFQIPMTTHDQPTSAQMAEFLRLVNDPARQPVYVHCVGGRHRTGVMTALYRMTQDGWTPDQAFKEMKQYGFGADFLHPEFKAFVYAYHPMPASPAALQADVVVATK